MSRPHRMKAFLFVPLLCFCPPLPAQITKPSPEGIPVHLQVEVGTPLRLYITQRVRYREGDLIQAKVADSVWAFDQSSFQLAPSSWAKSCNSSPYLSCFALWPSSEVILRR